MRLVGLILIMISGLWNCAAASQELELSPTGKFLCGGLHPRCSVMDQSTYGYHQFGGRHVGQYAGVSHLLEPGPALEHYQTFIGEVISQRADTNAVAIWGDASAVANNTKVWGGFFSARSAPASGDSQLVGVEIDVLNAGLPGVYPNHSKVGLSIVGFGNQNTNAIDIHTEGNGKGRFTNGIAFTPGAIADDGTVIGVAPQSARLGIDFTNSMFSDSLMLVSPNNKITFRDPGRYDAAIYRDQFDNGYLVLQAGQGGLRITTAQNTENLLIVKPDGDIITKYGSLRSLFDRVAALEARLQ